MGRVHLGFFIAVCLLVGRTGTAQVGSAGGPVAPGYYPYTLADPNVRQAGWQSGYAGAAPSYGPAQFDANPHTLYHLLPEDRHFIYDHDSRLDLTIRETVRGSWFRLEYLNWKISAPENVFLGAPSALQTNRLDITTGTLVASPNNPPLNPFDINFFDPLNPVPQIGRAQIPTTGDINWDNIDGIKGSFGIPITQRLWIEGSAWVLSQKTDYLNVPSLPASITVTNPNPIQFIATPLLTDGAVGTRVILYDNSFGGDYQMNVWSGEINLVFDTLTAEDQWTFQPLIGFKHTEYSEKLAFGGSFSNVSGFNVGAPVITDPVSNRIESDVTNWQYSMQFGFRSEFDYKVLTFGIEPKIAFGSNYARASVLTDNLREPGDVTGAIDDPTVLTADTRVVFAPTFDLGVYAKIHLTEWMNLRVGYNLVWLGRVSTAERNIDYNDIDDTQPPQVSVRQRFGSRVIDGISIGGEIILP